MPRSARETRWEEWKARTALRIGARASRQGGLVDRLCRRLLVRLMELPPEDDFMRDEWVDLDQGYDPEELARYERGELEETS